MLWVSTPCPGESSSPLRWLQRNAGKGEFEKKFEREYMNAPAPLPPEPPPTPWASATWPAGWPPVQRNSSDMADAIAYLAESHVDFSASLTTTSSLALDEATEESQMPSDTENMNLLVDIQQVCQHLDKTPNWVVIVCPSPGVAANCAKILASLLPQTAHFSGRTAILPGDRRISVVSASEPVFLPEDTAFSVAFVGWQTKDENEGMAKWQSRAVELIRVTA